MSIMIMNVIQKCLDITKSRVYYAQLKYLLPEIPFNKIVIKQYSSWNNKKPLLHNEINNKYICFSMNSVTHNTENSDDIEDISELYQYDEILQYQPVRNLLYTNLQDPLIDELNKCESVQDVFDIVRIHSENLSHKHITQAILILWDLQRMFYYRYQTDNRVQSHITIDNYILQLKAHPDFIRLMELIKTNCLNFTSEESSCILLYLNRLGLNIQHDVLQLLIDKLQKLLAADISLSALSRFIVAVFSEQNLRSYFILQDSIPIIEKKLDECTTAEELKLLTISLFHLNHIVPDSIVKIYVKKVTELLYNNTLNSRENRTLLKIIMFLSIPRLCNKYSILISEVMMLLKNHIHMLNVPDFFIAYEVLYKTHEPGELLTEMQRCASRLLLHLDEESHSSTEIRLKLLSAIICFSSPLQRPEYEKVIKNYIKAPLTKSAIFDILRILTFIKSSNVQVCEQFWNNILKTLKEQNFLRNTDMLLRLSQKYMNYSNDIHYRHYKFETEMINWLLEKMKNEIISLIPSQMSVASAFIISYAKDQHLIDYVIKKVADNWEQLNHADCLYISKALRNSSSNINTSQMHVIKTALDKAIKVKLLYTGNSMNMNFLLKSCIYRKHPDRKLIDKLLLLIEPYYINSSNSIRSIIFNLQSTNSVIPELIENIANYSIEHKDNLLGFNAEKVIYLCYYLGYIPQRSEELCKAVSDVIIRDQERISGLSYILATLSLCFFNKLPDSFIKNIFNVKFLEKLDSELSTCYFKDIYPIRVRHTMMQLNRAVCLDYPQANIPWFHQKYIEQLYKKTLETTQKEALATANIKSYLSKLVNDDCILESVNAAYGYYINLVIHLDSSGNAIKPMENDNATKIAILLMKPNTYTHINVQLRGQYQLKKRHLEILGYQVAMVDINKWNSFIYGEEKLEYLMKLIWPFNSNKNLYCAKER